MIEIITTIGQVVLTMGVLFVSCTTVGLVFMGLDRLMNRPN